MNFTLGLLEQLLEDMSSISDDFDNNDLSDALNGRLDKILAFIRYKILYEYLIHKKTCYF